MTSRISAWQAKHGFASFAIILSFTWGSLWLAGLSLEKAQPVETVISRVELLEPPEDATGRSLRVTVTAPPPGKCIRISSHFLYGNESGTPTFYPLGATMNGAGFRNRKGAGFGMQPDPTKPLEFVMILALPANIPDGDYQYVYRSLYTCLWLGGLVQRRILYEAPPIPVRAGQR
jgi:hypothetical protein